jgi:acetyl-CoA acyltransferase
MIMTSEKDNPRDALIVAAKRTAVGRAKRGSLATTRPDELAAAVIIDLIDSIPELDPKQIDDVVLGCAFPEGEQGMNVSRIALLRAGLPIDVPGMTVNRFCSG